MGEAGKVQGDKLTELFNQLIEKKVIIAMNVVGAGFDRLTCITAITTDRAGSHLLIDPPDDFKEAAAFALIGYPILTLGEEGGWKGAEYFGMAPDPTVCLCYGIVLLCARPCWALLLLPIPLRWTFASWATLDTFEAKTALVLPAIALIAMASVAMKAMPKSSSESSDK